MGKRFCFVNTMLKKIEFKKDPLPNSYMELFDSGQCLVIGMKIGAVMILKGDLYDIGK